MASYPYKSHDHSSLNDFTIIDEYSFGSNYFILSNASCLSDPSINKHKIFDNV